jgi:hypothetical protein
MSGLAKATLVELDGAAKPNEVGEPVKVQFNPSSLRLQMTNANEGGQARARQRQQHTGSGATTLTLDLHFDTADEGETDAPVNVRDKTSLVRRFLLPAEGSSQPPPRVRFHWGDFIFDGIVNSCTEELDLFSAGGVPLRAKCSISIKEQDSRVAANETGPGSGDTAGATEPGEGAGAPGTAGSGGDRTAPALGGESLADFAARMGLDPNAWRGLAAGLDLSLSLEAGLELDFSASLSASLGIGVSVGVEAGVDVSVEAAFGLETPERGTTSRSPEQAAGFALAKAGGVGAAIESVASAKAEEAAGRAVAAFAQPGAPAAPAAAPRPAPPAQSRPSLRNAGGLPSPVAQAAAPSAPAAPRADPRATSFGYGVPLRPRPQAAVMTGPAPATGLAGTPGWLALPKRGTGAAPAGAPKPPCRCGCGGSH